MGYGSLMSAFEILKNMNLFEDSVLCLAGSGRITDAKEYAIKCLKEKETPHLLCVYADILEDKNEKETLYLKAWNASNKTYARAMRSLGRLYLSSKEFVKSSESLKLALNINPQHSDCWVMLGNIYMSDNKWEDAIKALSQAVQLEETLDSSWNNLGLCFAKVNKNEQALIAFKQSVVARSENQRAWQNVLKICAVLEDFEEFITAARRMIFLGFISNIHPSFVAKIADGLSTRIINNGLNDHNKKLKEKLLGLFDLMREKVTISYSMASLNADIYDILEIDSMKIKSQDLEKEKKQKLLELKFKAIESIMLLGWENNKLNNVVRID